MGVLSVTRTLSVGRIVKFKYSFELILSLVEDKGPIIRQQ